MVYTMILVPYETLVPEMTDDFKQKTKFSGARISMAQMSAILASFLPGILLSWLGKDNASSFFYASLVFSVLCAVMLTSSGVSPGNDRVRRGRKRRCGRKRKTKLNPCSEPQSPGD
jgi:Na+/melibiose symporter-like transporter